MLQNDQHFLSLNFFTIHLPKENKKKLPQNQETVEVRTPFYVLLWYLRYRSTCRSQEFKFKFFWFKHEIREQVFYTNHTLSKQWTSFYPVYDVYERCIFEQGIKFCLSLYAGWVVNLCSALSMQDRERALVRIPNLTKN